MNAAISSLSISLPFDKTSKLMVTISRVGAGSMRFHSDKENREHFFTACGLDYRNVASVNQRHTKTVICTDTAITPHLHQPADGILTKNKTLIPSVVVADCMPIALYDSVTGCFGIVHSGWQGTGIAVEALHIAQKKYGAKPENFHILFGPHIHRCCYTVDKERADFFRTLSPQSITEDTTLRQTNSRWPYRLSLEHANRALLHNAGVPDSHIVDSGICTQCSTDTARPPVFLCGSHRREGSNTYTSMVAFVHFNTT